MYAGMWRAVGEQRKDWLEGNWSYPGTGLRWVLGKAVEMGLER